MSEKFSTSQASRDGISPDLKQWRDHSKAEERATLVFRLPSSADPDAVAAELGQSGVETESVGAEVITGNVARKDLGAALAVAGVLSVELAQQLSLKPDEEEEDRPLSGRSSPSGGKRSD